MQIPVSTENERGLLGIATQTAVLVVRAVFLYYTERDPLRDRIYKHQGKGKTLDNPQLILDLPAEPDPNRNGVKIVIGPDSY